ncbi:ferrous iron transport protein A [Oceanotoga sp. DSM 15011]|jgi:Fe2+ transport system protein FeoA|uniref:Ferrous iron transport protein A n=1 Tax=Oceanotoga teriensis TaxID=515440 RepID=A0AA45C976_9BACT|nr:MULTISPECIES: ferrous iron transport protein A [Oceanotoga]MDN5342946.1 ferrous iron transport protein [Oceanotoga sp.]MDO7975323.1 ferrous iron transport protein A [Oceanotoga teriensis]PWJ96655.1 ferrous iron transport protein A [Oceanotoga teriensis]UYP00174.1 ferrous iron transport protein A [Oceanotoga sp. DSM 15011]
MFLDECEVGYSGKIKKLEGNLKVRQRLLAMGLTPGIEILLVRKAPLGDPLEIKIRNYSLSLRKEEAKYIEITGGDRV